MCGIVSLAYGEDNPDLGKEGAALLRKLEYRGYDSTGASFIDGKGVISLMKKVGSPTKVCRELGVERWGGRRFIGQVRWATYGSVSDVNSQPHHVRCKVEMVGAHNGNISNTDSLKKRLGAAGHKVVSDNDGEIIVHLVEDAYAANLASPEAALSEARRAWSSSGLGAEPPAGVFLMIDAIRKADALAEGSYAAAVSDPNLPGVFAMKSGSSLYAGIGTDDRGPFVVVSSDLSSVLSKTRSLIPLAEGEGLWFSESDYLVFSLGGEAMFAKPRRKRSKLDVRDTALDPRYRHYMDQEIRSSPENVERVARYYFRDPAAEPLATLLEEKHDLAKTACDRIAALADLHDESELKAGLEEIMSGADWAELAARAKSVPLPSATMISEERILLAELAHLAPSRSRELALADALFVWKKRRAVVRYLGELGSAMRETAKSGGRIFLVASGTSYHASLVAAYFFDALAKIPVYPCNPGMFRSMYLSSLTERDLLLGVTQSGETKDLVDIYQEIRDRVPGLRRASLVNNENSRIPQELSDFYLPILCGPETAVAATKSFTNQLAILYAVAASMSLPERVVADNLRKAESLIAETLKSADGALDATADRLYMRPSIHILGTGLIGLAKEGALKIREVVLNHAEGYDAAEFKHGPNTILGKNTLFSADDIALAIGSYRKAEKADPALAKADPMEVLRKRPEILEGLFRHYPLVFVCPPEERDIRITISQIHTHKIRGADVVLFAERDPELALAVEGRPAGDERYWSKYVEIPRSGDRCLFVFAAAAALQLLSYKMSVRKMEALDSLGVADHGVHPDAPKNVSKSITVD